MQISDYAKANKDLFMVSLTCMYNTGIKQRRNKAEKKISLFMVT